MWVLPPFLTIWSHGSVPSFPAEEGGASCWSWYPPTPFVLSGPGYVAGAEQGCSLSRRHCRPPFPSSAGCGSVLTPRGILEVALLGSLSWECSPLITDYEQPFPCFEARCKCLLPLEAFRSLRPSVPLSCVFSSS